MSRLFDEFDKFKYMLGESYSSYYQRFSKVMNGLKLHLVLPTTIASNSKFLNSLQPEWKKYATMVCQAKNLHEFNFDQLYDYLQHNEELVNALREKRAPNTPVAKSYAIRSSSHSPILDISKQPTYVSSNTYNQAYVQDGQIDVQANTTRSVGYAGNARRSSGRIVGTSRNDANVQRVVGNTRNVQKMLLAMKDEVRIALTEKENDFLLVEMSKGEELDDLSASCIMMARIQEV
nr:hypothetical protein [Tanacetum cinerariifolium]